MEVLVVQKQIELHEYSRLWYNKEKYRRGGEKMSTKSVGSVKSIVSYGSSSKKSKSSSSQSGKSSVSGKSKTTNSKSSKAGVSTKSKANSSQGTKANAKTTNKARSSQNDKASTKENSTNSTVTLKNSVKLNNMVVKAASQISTTIQQMNAIQTGKNDSANKNVENRTTYITDAPALYTSSGQKISSSVAQVYSTKKEEPSLSSYSYNQPSCVYEEQVKQLKKKVNKNQKAINEPKATPIPTPVVKTKNQTKKVYEPSESRHGAGAVSKTKPSSSKVAKETASLIISTVPVIGDIKDAQEALTGKDLITKKKLSKVDRGISSVSVVAPIVSGKSITSMEKLMSNLKEDIWDSVKKNNLSDKRADGLKEIGERVKKSIEETEKERKKKKVFTDNPFRKDEKLKPNVRYKAGEFGYNYETDEKGRISNWNTDNLQITKRENRLPHNPNTPDKKEGDHAGHLAGDKFGGSPEIDNLVSQSSVVNQSVYRRIEIKWQKAIEAEKKVTVNMDIDYEGDSLRPSEFTIKYKIDDSNFAHRF